MGFVDVARGELLGGKHESVNFLSTLQPISFLRCTGNGGNARREKRQDRERIELRAIAF